MSIELLKQDKAFGGMLETYRHTSAVNNCFMQFSVYRPPQSETADVPLLTWLSGLTCNEETFMIKAGAQRIASELGIMLVAPDTSPRGEEVPDDDEGAYDFGHGAGFYVDATEDPWKQNYNMYRYVIEELPDVIFQNFSADKTRHGIFGHSMGGHGALSIGLKHPEIYSSISAFAPICNPINCPWGKKALSNYLGDDHAKWNQYDATEIVQSDSLITPKNRILIDQGLADEFLERELNTDRFEQVCIAKGIDIEIRRHADYGHGYYFISTFIEDHIKHHAQFLCK
ncbi:MAG: S-formylglutathione hydrolase [Pseudomonadota bacterium]|nr:S-formylglutathione hydrolase [Pseudomonadota bacterium]